MRTAQLVGASLALGGLVLAVVQFLHGLQGSPEPIVLVLDAGPFVLLGLAVAFGGVWLARTDSLSPDEPVVAGWTLGGTVLFAAVGALAVFGQNVSMGTLDRALVVTADHVTVGAAVGLVVGLYDARNRQQRRDLRRQRDRIEAFGNKAADVNTYGRALSECDGVDELGALCVEGLQNLLSLHRVAVVLVDDRELHVVESTLGVDDDALAELAVLGRSGDRGTVERWPDPPEDLAVEGAEALTARLGRLDDRDLLVLALTRPDTRLGDEDVTLAELLCAHAESRVGMLSDPGRNRL